MKPLLILCIALLSTSSIYAQIEESTPTEEEPSPYRLFKHELGFGIIGGGDVRQQFWALPGLTYRYFLPNGAIRVMVGGTLNQNSTGGGGFTNTNTTYGFVSRIGYQYHVMLGRFMPRIGCDVSGGMFEESWNSGTPEKNANRSFSVGLSPTIGMEFWFSPKFSMAVDTRFDVAFRDFTSNYSYIDWQTGQTITTTTRSRGINTTVGPISSFTFGFHF
jgi:hypothetical protein